MKIVHSLALLAITVLATSCSIQGFTNDYRGLPAEQKERIVPMNNFAEAQEGKIYKVNGAQLRTEIVNHPKALVYVFTNGCTSEYCKPLMVYEHFAKRNNYKLYLVMNGYRALDKTLEQPVSSPLYSIDNDYYHKSWRSLYVNYFTNDLTGKPFKEKEKEYLGDMYFFENGKLEKVVRELPAG